MGGGERVKLASPKKALVQQLFTAKQNSARRINESMRGAARRKGNLTTGSGSSSSSSSRGISGISCGRRGGRRGASMLAFISIGLSVVGPSLAPLVRANPAVWTGGGTNRLLIIMGPLGASSGGDRPARTYELELPRLISPLPRLPPPLRAAAADAAAADGGGQPQEERCDIHNLTAASSNNNRNPYNEEDDDDEKRTDLQEDGGWANLHPTDNRLADTRSRSSRIDSCTRTGGGASVASASDSDSPVGPVQVPRDALLLLLLLSRVLIRVVLRQLVHIVGLPAMAAAVAVAPGPGPATAVVMAMAAAAMVTAPVAAATTTTTTTAHLLATATIPPHPPILPLLLIKLFFVLVPILLLLLLILTLFLSHHSITLFSSSTTNTSRPISNMTSRNNDHYNSLVREIEELEKKNLPKSGLEKATELLHLARDNATTDPAMLLKALCLHGRLQCRLEEDGVLKSIQRLQHEINQVQHVDTLFALTAVLKSMLAEAYDKYLAMHLNNVMNLKNMGDHKSDKIETWTKEQLIRESATWYHASIADPRIKNINIEDLQAALTKQENAQGLRPTLYDFLVHRAIDFFVNERNYLTLPVYAFEIIDPMPFAPYAQFVNWDIQTQDSSSTKVQTLKLFQELLRFRAQQAHTNPAALVDADLKRLKFVYNNARFEAKDQAYKDALNTLKDSVQDTDAAADILLAIAELTTQQGHSYTPVPFGAHDIDPTKWAWKEAKDIYHNIIDKYPTSVAASTAKANLVNITQPSLSVQVDQVVVPNTNILIHISYTNLTKLYFRLLQLSPEQEEEFENPFGRRTAHNEQQIMLLSQLSPTTTWAVDLPEVGDLRSHSVEIKYPGMLNIGKYVLVASQNETLQPSSGAITYSWLHISNIAYHQQASQEQNPLQFVIVDRTTGAPIQGATVEVWNTNHDYNAQRWVKERLEVIISDSNGFITPTPKDRSNIFLVIKNGNDSLCTNDSYYNPIQRKTPKRANETTHFFLDRAIYRPGQTVYFKGIAMVSDSENPPQLITNSKVTVTFKDANFREVAKSEINVNEYGTFNGHFTIPSSGRLGSMRLESSIGGGYVSFSVEEYKRPKFQVIFDPVKDAYRVNDTVSVSGIAQSYSGANVDGAIVKYRVERKSLFPWWRSFWCPPPFSSVMEVAHGTTQTDEKGAFSLSFLAVPDLKISEKTKPEFHYTVYADITDISGETQSQSTTVIVGYISMKIDVPIKTESDKAKLDKVIITTKNLNGEYQKAVGKIILHKLKTPSTVFLKRYWDLPDQRIMTEQQFRQDFPQYPWATENSIDSWEPDTLIVEQDFDTDQSKEFVFHSGDISPGSYCFKLKTSDRFGSDVEKEVRFNVFDLESDQVPGNLPIWQYFEEKPYEPEQEIKFYFGSSQSTTMVLFSIMKGNKIIDTKWLTVNGMVSTSYKVQESDRGNISYSYTLVKSNRAENEVRAVSVPWSNKDLKLEFQSFRDKLKPGQDEEWIITVKGPKGEKVAAEMVAAMYDASLNAFKENVWNFSVFPMSYSSLSLRPVLFQQAYSTFLTYFENARIDQTLARSYYELDWFGWDMRYVQPMPYSMRRGGPIMMMCKSAAPVAESMMMNDAVMVADAAPAALMGGMGASGGDMPEMASYSANAAPPPPPPPVDLSKVSVRTNLEETVFFYPELMTDPEGNVVIRFKMNEALTRWKFMGFAHTKELESGLLSKEIVTQKDLMIVPNPPRFFRENDEIVFTAKAVNMTDATLSGKGQLQLINPISSKAIYEFDNDEFTKTFSVDANQSTLLSWRFKVPNVAQVPVIEHTVIAHVGDFSDAERNTAPVLTDRILVTETKPLPVRGKTQSDFVLESLANTSSTSLVHQGVTLEFTQNTSWYAVQALPYLMEQPGEMADFIMYRYYANVLASHIVNAHPKIKNIFDVWRKSEPDALLSNLSKNVELKNALLEETPWVFDCQNEEKQKQNIAVFFDLNRMGHEKEVTLKRLKERQMPSGGWSWLPGPLREDLCTTLAIVEKIGHLMSLGVSDISSNPDAWDITTKAVSYCDKTIRDIYDRLGEQVAKGNQKWEDDHLSCVDIQYLYVRSFFLTGENGQHKIPLPEDTKVVFDYYLDQAKRFWPTKSSFMAGKIALALFRVRNRETADEVVKSLKENSFSHPELGMYWKNTVGYFWHENPTIETQALMIEVFTEIAQDIAAVDEMKLWLLKNKQTNSWNTCRRTAAAVYAFLKHGTDWLMDSEKLTISIGNAGTDQCSQWTCEIEEAQTRAQAGLAYFKVRYDGKQVTPELSHVSVNNPNTGAAWGGIYWQYFEQMDKIQSFEETPLKLKKALFHIENGDLGETLRPETEGHFQVGEKVMVRIELTVDREMEYIHMKDMRASGFEPVNIFSTYKYQGGLGYYESTRDTCTSFYFGSVYRGTYVFEYPVRVVHKGDFSNGITTIQSLYAPEFSSHSEGMRVTIK